MIKIKVRYLKSFLDKIRGLSGLTKVYPVYFETRFGIHTFGMLVPIDVLILDQGNKIVKIKRNIKPGNLFFWNPRHYKVLEIPVNSFQIEIFDKVKLSYL